MNNFKELLDEYKKEVLANCDKKPDGFYGNLAFHKECERKLKFILENKNNDE